MKRLFMLLGILFSITTVFSQNIIKAEYFIDLDPGQGNGTAITNLTPGELVNFSFAVPTANLSNGFHFLNIRVKDANGVWSSYETRIFYLSGPLSSNTTNIAAAEYFIDSDTVPGSGIPINIGAPASPVNFTVQIPATLSTGFHVLGIRVKDQEGKWSLFEERSFYLSGDGTNASPIIAAEYFYDSDPGFGSASPLVVNPTGDIITQTFLIPVPAGLSQGEHVLAIRIKNQQGHWSFFAKDTITVGNNATISCPSNSVFTASPGQCTAVINGIDPTVSAGSSYTYTLSGATSGSGNGTASGKTFNVGVTTITYALTSSPSVSCSFTVTVNSTIIPAVTITAPTTATCPGSTLTFTATPTNGGINPTYQWKKNGIDFGTGTNILQSNVWANGDIVSVIMTSSLACATPLFDTSNAMTVTVTPPYITPTINITASTTTICPGSAIIFFATQTNGGMAPSYGWYVNGIWAGPTTDFNSFETSTLQNGDKVRCVLTSSLACVTDVTTVSNEITITVLPILTPQVSVAASSDTICAGSPVFFIATPTHGGSAPYYEWMVNGNVVQSGTNDSTFESWTLQNSDVVKVRLASSLWCTNPQVVTSNSIAMTVLPSTPAFVTIVASQTTICAGQSVTFNVTLGPPGAMYQWQLNGNNIPGATGTTYQSSTLQHGHKIRVIMTPASPCATPSPAISNEITITVNGGPATVTIAASQTTICAGQLVTFTSAITNGGTDPTYEWTLNGNVVGSNSNAYQTTSLQNGDVVRLTVQPYGSCAGNAPVYSNTITFSVNSSVTPSVIISASNTTICSGRVVTFTATPANGGSPVYQWKLNGMNVGMNSSTFMTHTLINGDVVKVEMTSSLDCASPSTVISNSITMTVMDATTYYRDADGDGYGSLSSGSVSLCAMPAGYVINNDDCDDGNASVNPGAEEICGNGVDDNCDGTIDEGCTSELPVLLVKTYPVKEGDAGYTILNVEVKLDHPGSSPVTVHYATSNGNAIAGSDYVAANGVLTIPVGALTGTLQVRIIGDILSEYNESFWINFTNPVNVLLGSDPRGRIMIIDDDKGKPTTRSQDNEALIDQSSLKIPTIIKRGQVWMIPQIGNYENEVLIVNVQGQIVARFINYENQTAVGNVATGLYFYRIRITEGLGRYKYYSGRMLITE